MLVYVCKTFQRVLTHLYSNKPREIRPPIPGKATRHKIMLLLISSSLFLTVGDRAGLHEARVLTCP